MVKYNIKQIKDLYYNQKLTLRQIAKMFDVCHVTILDFMEKNNLKRRNHTESQIGKKVPKEVKEKMSKAHKGLPVWNKGLKMSKEYCIRIKKMLLARDFKGKNHPNWKGGWKSLLPNCIDCGKQLSTRTGKRCKSCYGKFNKGKHHYNWLGGISKSPYAEEWTLDLKHQIRERDHFICQHCGKTEEENVKKTKKCLTVHHIDYNKMNCNENNLITLCANCHNISNGNRDYWFAYYMWIIEHEIFKGE